MTETQQLLLAAAQRLRQRAGHKGVPEGPWFIRDDGRRLNLLAPDPSWPSAPWDVVPDLPENDQGISPLGEYLVLWSPEVATLLADWLTEHAQNATYASPPAAELARKVMALPPTESEKE